MNTVTCDDCRATRQPTANDLPHGWLRIKYGYPPSTFGNPRELDACGAVCAVSIIFDRSTSLDVREALLAYFADTIAAAQPEGT